MVPLEELMATRLGGVDPSKFADETFELYSIPAYDSRNPEIVVGANIGSTKQIVQPRDVLLSKIVPHIRRSWIVGPAGEYRQIASGEWIVFRSDDAAPEYLRHVLMGDDFHAQFMQTVSGVGGSLLRARPAQVAKIRISLPALPEQRRIAAILDKADALRTKRGKALNQLDSLAQAIFVQMFGDPVTNPKGWPKRKLQEMCETPDDIKCGPFGTQLAKSEFITEGVPLWGIRNVNAMFQRPTEEFVAKRTAERLRSYSIRGGDIVMTRKGTVGNCAIYPRDFPDGIMHSDLLRLRTCSRQCTPEFLSHQLHYSKDVERQLALISGGAVMPGINVSRLKSLEVLSPPLDQQIRFGESIERAGKLRRLELRALHELNSMFSSLQCRAFRGEL